MSSYASYSTLGSETFSFVSPRGLFTVFFTIKRYRVSGWMTDHAEVRWAKRDGMMAERIVGTTEARQLCRALLTKGYKRA